LIRNILLSLAALLLIVFSFPGRATACEPEPITVNTPTGIAGCEVWGEGIASHYGPGDGVAMNFCTWERRDSEGCGFARITSLDSGRTAVVPVVDFCDCYTGTADQRVVDMQYGVLGMLGLDRSQGLYNVRVDRITTPASNSIATVPLMLPDTATDNCGGLNGVLLVTIGVLALIAAGGVAAAIYFAKSVRL
jgi:hypothetical protein